MLLFVVVGTLALQGLGIQLAHDPATGLTKISDIKEGSPAYV